MGRLRDVRLGPFSREEVEGSEGWFCGADGFWGVLTGVTDEGMEGLEWPCAFPELSLPFRRLEGFSSQNEKLHIDR